MSFIFISLLKIFHSSSNKDANNEKFKQTKADVTQLTKSYCHVIILNQTKVLKAPSIKRLFSSFNTIIWTFSLNSLHFLSRIPSRGSCQPAVTASQMQERWDYYWNYCQDNQVGKLSFLSVVEFYLWKCSVWFRLFVLLHVRCSTQK